MLQAMSASPGDPKPVFEVIVRRARDLCDAHAASLAQVVNGSIVVRAYAIATKLKLKGTKPVSRRRCGGYDVRPGHTRARADRIDRGRGRSNLCDPRGHASGTLFVLRPLFP